MKHHQLISAKGEPYSIDVPAPMEMDSFFVFSLPKAGSTLLDNIMRDVCHYQNIPSISIASDSFKAGLVFDHLGPEVEQVLFRRGYAYLGFRVFFEFQPEFDFSGHKKIFLIRDPRDMLTSLYFSLKHSHHVPKSGSAGERLGGLRDQLQQSDINSEWLVEWAYKVKHIFDNYHRNIEAGSLKVYRYEDVIFNKRAWIKDMIEYLGLKLGRRQVNEILNRYDIVPDSESPDQHIRQVRPGNYKKHLTADSIKLLNDIFSEVLDKYRYE